MNKKHTLFIIILAMMSNSCGETMSSVKRGLSGEKSKSTDEFLVEKKDPLILPPDFDELPSPKEVEESKKKVVLSLEKKLNETPSDNKVSSSEQSILNKIRKK